MINSKKFCWITNSVGLPKGVQPRLGEGGGNLSQWNNNITNDFVSVGIAQNEYVLFIIMGYLLLLLKWNTFFLFCQFENFLFPSQLWKCCWSPKLSKEFELWSAFEKDLVMVWYRGHSFYHSLTQLVLTVIWQIIFWIYHAVTSLLYSDLLKAGKHMKQR